MTFPLNRRSIVLSITSEHAAVRREGLALLRLFSRSPRGRRLATDSLDVPR
ncbi:hypothetical protein EYF80_062705 [Liparis tanakae]|uniref:Uncharacterized protein n=1 Tax=Liparis tanakae TaxID=230148 RepID=A0A4Z2EEJ7_9TELE|nr:hypothetical protein EYF80_062705 [Liparis tanakae]